MNFPLHSPKCWCSGHLNNQNLTVTNQLLPNSFEICYPIQVLHKLFKVVPNIKSSSKQRPVLIVKWKRKHNAFEHFLSHILSVIHLILELFQRRYLFNKNFAKLKFDCNECIFKQIYRKMLFKQLLHNILSPDACKFGKVGEKFCMLLHLLPQILLPQY